jgi:hypothetical protein
MALLKVNHLTGLDRFPPKTTLGETFLGTS